MSLLCKDCSCDENNYFNPYIPPAMLCDPLDPTSKNTMRIGKYTIDEFYDRTRPVSMLNLFKQKINRVMSRRSKDNFHSRIPNYGGSNYNLNENFNYIPNYNQNLFNSQNALNPLYKDPLKRSCGACNSLTLPSCKSKLKKSVSDTISESQKPPIVSKEAITSSFSMNDNSEVHCKSKENETVLNAIKDLYSLLINKFQDKPESCACNCKESILNKMETIKETIQLSSDVSLVTPSLSKLTNLKEEIYELKTKLLELKLQNADMRLKSQSLQRIDRSVSTNHRDLQPQERKKKDTVPQKIEQPPFQSSNSPSLSQCSIVPNMSPNSSSSAFNNRYNNVVIESNDMNDNNDKETAKNKFNKKLKRNKVIRRPSKRKTVTTTATALANNPVTKQQYVSMKTESSTDSNISSIQSFQISDDQNYNHNHNQENAKYSETDNSLHKNESSPETKNDLDVMADAMRSKKKCNQLYKSNKNISFIASLARSQKKHVHYQNMKKDSIKGLSNGVYETGNKPKTIKRSRSKQGSSKTQILSLSANATTLNPFPKQQYVSIRAESSMDSSISSIQSLQFSDDQNHNHNHNQHTNKTATDKLSEKNHSDQLNESEYFQVNHVRKPLPPTPQKQVEPNMHIEAIVEDFNTIKDVLPQKSKSRITQRNFVESIMKESFPEDYKNNQIEDIIDSSNYNHHTEVEIKPRPKFMFSPKDKKQRLPIHPSDIEVGDLVRFARNGSKICMGIVRYIGELPFQKEIFLGIELETEDGLHDGVYYGKRYFKCLNMRGIFVSFQRVLMVFKK